MEEENQKLTLSEKCSNAVAPLGRFAKTFPTVKEYFVIATLVFFAVGILNIVQLGTVKTKLCEIRPGFVYEFGTDGMDWTYDGYTLNCDCPDTFVTVGGEAACGTSTTSSTTQPPVVDSWQMPARRLENNISNGFETDLERVELAMTANPHVGEEEYSSWFEFNHYSRYLQAADPVYTATDWGPCQCETTADHPWGVCGSGYQERTVDCTSSSGCPLSRQPCICSHCADCQADIFILISAILFLLQAGCAGLVVLGLFVHESEEDKTNVKLSSKVLGFFCKRMPTISRCAQLGQGAILVYILCMAFVPNFQRHCKGIPVFRDFCLVVVIAWSIMFLLGILASRRAQVPPWLYTPTTHSNGIVGMAIQAFRALGP